MKRVLFLISITVICLFISAGALADPPINDDCADAYDLGTLVIDSTVGYSGTLVDATPDCDYIEYSEVWIKFTIASSMNVTIDFCDDDNYYEQVSYYLYGACPCDDLTYRNSTDYCSFNGNPSLTWLGLAAGTYYYPIWSDMDAQNYTVNVTAVEPPAAPDNDDCADAIEVGEVTDQSFTTLGASFDGEGSCVSSPNVWYLYAPTFTGAARISLEGSNYGTKFAVYDGDSCSLLPEELGCTTEQYLDVSVITGNSYLIEIGAYNNSSGDGLLTIGQAPDTPPNDDCADAMDAGILDPESGPVQLTGSLAEATRDCESSPQAEVWVQFSIESCMNVTIDFCDDENEVSEPATILFRECPCDLSIETQIMGTCSYSENPFLSWYSLDEGTYYYPIYIGYMGSSTYTVNIAGEECLAPPVLIPVTAPDTVIGTTCGSLNNCQGAVGEDVIYEVTIPTYGNWVFSLCNSDEVWDSYLSLGTDTCGYDLGVDFDGCGEYQGHAELFVSNLASGTYYLTIDSYNQSECGDYILEITPQPMPCVGSYYTNGDPDYEDDIESYRDEEYNDNYWAADDFILTESITMDSIKFICAYATDDGGDDGDDGGDKDDNKGFTGYGDYLIIANNEGAPGDVLYEGTGIACTQIYFGYEYGDEENEMDVYAYQFDNLDIDLSAGTYFLACRTVSSSTYWLTTNSQSGTTVYYKNGETTEWELAEVEKDLAFCLFASTGGDAYEYLPGDANMSTGNWPPSTIGGDVTYLVNYFRGITAPCMLDGFYASADANGSCSVTGADVTKLVSYFRGMDDLNYCPDYPTTWPPIPDTAPDGWPNCTSPILSR